MIWTADTVHVLSAGVVNKRPGLSYLQNIVVILPHNKASGH